MRTFRGPHPHRLPGMPHDDSSDEEEDEDLVIIQPVFHAVEDSDESEDELDETERIGFNLQFQPHQHYFLNGANNDDDDDEEDEEEEEEEDDEEEDDEDDDENEMDNDNENGSEEDLEGDADIDIDIEEIPLENGVGGDEEDVVDSVEKELNDLEDVLISTPSATPPSHSGSGLEDGSVARAESNPSVNHLRIQIDNEFQRALLAPFASSESDDGNDMEPGAGANLDRVTDIKGENKSAQETQSKADNESDSNTGHNQNPDAHDFNNDQMNNLDIEMSRSDDSPPYAMGSSESPPLSSGSTNPPPPQLQRDEGDPQSNSSRRIHPCASQIEIESEIKQKTVNSMDTSPLKTAQSTSDVDKSEDHSDSRSLSDSEHEAEAMDHEDEDQDPDEEEEEEQFCNPMVSSADDQENEDVLRGDRIGSTTYSERHILKILMNWVEKLPQLTDIGIPPTSSLSSTKSPVTAASTVDGCPSSATSSPVVSIPLPINPQDRPLDDELEESMSLLWDMSTETDVMYFLIDNNILLMIRDNLDSANCPTRLKEIALGILANLLSCSSILENFPEKDEHLNLVDRVVMEALTSTAVPLLTQVFAVLRRVVCYIRNAKPLERWMKLFLHPDFIQAANFLLASSTNVILLGDVIMMLFTLMEVLSPPHEFEFLDSSLDEKSKYEESMASNFKPFIQSEFVPSVCEGLNELLKDSHSRRMDHEAGIIGGVGGEGSALRNNPGNTDPTKLPHCATTGNGPDEDRDDFVVPPGHVQTACLNGLASLCYLQKFKAGRSLLKKHHKSVMEVLLSLFRKFRFCTERIDGPDILDYYALAVDLLTQCHVELDHVLPSAITIPTSATILLVEEEGKKEKEQDHEHHKTHLVTIDASHSSIITTPGSGQESNSTDTTATEGGESLLSSSSASASLSSSTQPSHHPQSIEIKSSDVSPFTIIFYNYLIALEEKFGQEEIKKVIRNCGKSKKKLTDFYVLVRQVADKVHRNESEGKTECQ